MNTSITTLTKKDLLLLMSLTNDRIRTKPGDKGWVELKDKLTAVYKGM